MRGNPYLSRPVGSKEPYSLRRPPRIVVKEVFIGTHNPGDHFAPVSRQWVPEGQLYDSRRKRRD